MIKIWQFNHFLKDDMVKVSKEFVLSDAEYTCYNGKEWVKLLTDHPECAEQCNWDALDGRDWGELLRGQPQFADRCPWGRLGDEDWADLLMVQPQFRERPERAKFQRKKRAWLVLKAVSWVCFTAVVVAVIAFARRAWDDWPDSEDPSLYAPQERCRRAVEFLERRMFRDGNKRNALKWVESAANDNYVDAQYAMGMIYGNGALGVCKDEKEALKWYRLAFAQKNMPACFAEVKMKLPQLSFYPRCKLGGGFAHCVLATDTGCVLISPINVETDVEETAFSLEKAKAFLIANEPGTDQMLVFLMNGARRIDENAFNARGIRCLSEQELIKCAVDYFSEVRERVREGVMAFAQKDYNAAASVLINADLTGDIQAQFVVGQMYANGWGVVQDEKVASEWFEKAAGLGHASAAMELKKLQGKSNATHELQKSQNTLPLETR